MAGFISKLCFMQKMNKKTVNRKNRLQSAKNWIEKYNGENFVKGYSNRYRVDKLCAIKELRMLGIVVSEKYETELKRSLEDQKQMRQSRKLKEEQELNMTFGLESDAEFAFIAGYTSGGFPYGITHDEMNDLNNKDKE